MFLELLAAYAGYNYAQAQNKVKRYIVNANVTFGKSFKIPALPLTLTGNKPPDGRIKIFNSAKDLIADYSANGTQAYYDTAKNPEIKNVNIESPSTIQAIIEHPGNPYEVIKNKKFVCSFYLNGVRKYFYYDQRIMLMYMNYANDKDAFKRLQEAATLEQSLREFQLLANRNANALSALAKVYTKLSPAQQAKFHQAVADHKYQLNTINSVTPVGYHFEFVTINPAVGNPVIIVVIVIAALVIGGVVAVNVVKAIAEVIKRKATLNSNYKNMLAIADADKMYQAGLITKEGRDAMVKAATQNVTTGNETITAENNAAASTGFFGQIKSILFIGGGIFLAKEIFKNNGKVQR